MKKLRCELCGSTDLIKKDGIYVCNSCGSKFTVEEARKMMVEVEGDVNVKNMGNVENYIVMAKNAFSSKNNKEAENYCNKAIEINTESYEAWLIKGKAAGWQSTIANIRFPEALNCFENAIKYAPEDKKEEIKKETFEEARNLLDALNQLACGHYLDYPSADNANSIINSLIAVKDSIDAFKSKVANIDFSSDDLKLAKDINATVVSAYSNIILKEYIGDEGHPDKFDFENFRDRAIAANGLLDICLLFAETSKETQITILENKLIILQELVKCCSYTKEYLNGGSSYWRVEYTLTEEGKQKILDLIMQAHEKIKELNPDYIIPDRNSIKTKQGCYIATAVYGSYDCPQVWTLRRYRDNVLDMHWYGRLFIKTYYKISPKFVKMFGKTKWFNNIFKRKLDKMVNKLNKSGVESTPYNDKY